jgi:hypothetical protein
VNERVKKHDPEGEKIRCLVTLYGVPLRILPTKPTPEESKQLHELKKKMEWIKRKQVGRWGKGK